MEYRYFRIFYLIFLLQSCCSLRLTQEKGNISDVSLVNQFGDKVGESNKSSSQLPSSTISTSPNSNSSDNIGGEKLKQTVKSSTTAGQTTNRSQPHGENIVKERLSNKNDSLANNDTISSDVILGSDAKIKNNSSKKIDSSTPRSIMMTTENKEIDKKPTSFVKRLTDLFTRSKDDGTLKKDFDIPAKAAENGRKTEVKNTSILSENPVEGDNLRSKADLVTDKKSDVTSSRKEFSDKKEQTTPVKDLNKDEDATRNDTARNKPTERHNKTNGSVKKHSKLEEMAKLKDSGDGELKRGITFNKTHDVVNKQGQEGTDRPKEGDDKELEKDTKLDRTLDIPAKMQNDTGKYNKNRNTDLDGVRSSNLRKEISEVDQDDNGGKVNIDKEKFRQTGDGSTIEQQTYSGNREAIQRSNIEENKIADKLKTEKGQINSDVGRTVNTAAHNDLHGGKDNERVTHQDDNLTSSNSPSKSHVSGAHNSNENQKIGSKQDPSDKNAKSDAGNLNDVAAEKDQIEGDADEDLEEEQDMNLGSESDGKRRNNVVKSKTTNSRKEAMEQDHIEVKEDEDKESYSNIELDREIDSKRYNNNVYSKTSSKQVVTERSQIEPVADITKEQDGKIKLDRDGKRKNNVINSETINARKEATERDRVDAVADIGKEQDSNKKLDREFDGKRKDDITDLRKSTKSSSRKEDTFKSVDTITESNGYKASDRGKMKQSQEIAEKSTDKNTKLTSISSNLSHGKKVLAAKDEALPGKKVVAELVTDDENYDDDEFKEFYKNDMKQMDWNERSKGMNMKPRVNKGRYDDVVYHHPIKNYELIYYVLYCSLLVLLIFVLYHCRLKVFSTLCTARHAISALMKTTKRRTGQRSNVSYRRLSTAVDETLPSVHGEEMVHNYIY